MKLSLKWLKDYIDPKLSTDKLIERLTMAGLEVETVESVDGNTVLEIEVTPNRPDCLSILGLAREIGAITGRRINYPGFKNFKTAVLKGLIHVENKKDCGRYIGTLIRDAHITDSPPEMKMRLASLGLAAINNAVDITNFVLMETGQPLHAFDYDKLAGGKLRVRRAQKGESIVTLDGIERKLDTDVLVIADTQKPVAIAGIMGGMDAQITGDTKNILLESAHFDMGLIRRVSRRLGLRSESSYRFERHVSFEGVLTSANRATDLLLQLTGGRLSGRDEISAKPKSAPLKIKIDIADIESLLGMKITTGQVKTWLGLLGFKVTVSPRILTVIPPTVRMDIQQDADVIEEIARMIGYNRLPTRLPMVRMINIPIGQGPSAVKNQIRRILTAGSVDEIITHSTTSGSALTKSNMSDIPLDIVNPISQDQESLRPGMLPSFLQVAVTNINRGQKDLRFFEIAKTYLKEKERAKEQETLGILLTGRRTYDWRLDRKDTVEIFDLKGLLERIFQKVGIDAIYEDYQTPIFDSACGTKIEVNGKRIGQMGKINRAALNNWDIKHQDFYFAEVYLDNILSMPAKIIKYQPVSEFPAIMRDVSLAVKKEIPYKKVEEICLRQGEGILKSVQFMEQYLGDKIQHGYKGLVFSCQYQSHAKTLREEEVSNLHERMVQALIHELGAIRR